MRIRPVSRTVPLPAPEEPDFGIASLPSPERRRPDFPRLVETAAETLWAILLFLVIGFCLWKAPAISAAFDEAAGAFHRGSEPAIHANDGQIQDLEVRMAGDELKLRTLERGYVQLKQRHADLLRAYAEVLESRQPPAIQGPVAPATIRTRK